MYYRLNKISTKLVFLLSGMLALSLSSCKEPQPIAFITNLTESTIVIYNVRDSIMLFPQQRSYLANVTVEDDIIVGSNGRVLSLFKPLTHIRVQDSLYIVSEEYAYVFKDINNYRQSITIQDNKYVSISYDFFLTNEVLKKLINHDLMN